MSMAPSVESSSFSQYSSNPTPPVSAQPGVGTGGWFKEHALIILLAVVALVAILWYMSRRSSASNLSPDNGYPLGYPSVGAGTSGGSGAASGSSGSGDTGTGSTSSDEAIREFMAGFQLRDGQVKSESATVTSPAPNNITNYYTTPDPVAPNVITNNYYQPAAVTAPPPSIPVAQTQTLQRVATVVAAQTTPLVNAIQSQTGAPPKAGSTIANAIGQITGTSTGTHHATSNKTTTKKKQTYQKGTAGPRAV